MTQEAGVVKAEIVDGSRQLSAELRSQRELALSQPRYVKRVYVSCLQELELAPEFAEDAYYSIPFKSGGEQTLVEGLSVKAARAIVRLWGNCALGSRLIDEDAEAVTVEGIFVDFETNVYFRKVQRVPRTYIPRGTSIPTPLKSDRLNMAIQAGMGKAERNAALAGLPEPLKERYFLLAKKIAGQKGKTEGKTVEERMAALFTAFSKLNVDKVKIEAYIKAKFPEGTDPDDLLGTMRGVFNAIKDGQAKADEIFADTTSKPAAGTGAVKLEDIPGATSDTL